MYKQHRQPSTEAQKFGRLADHLTDSACIAISDLRWLGDVKASRLEAPRGCACDCWHYRRGARRSSGTRASTFEPREAPAASSRTHPRAPGARGGARSARIWLYMPSRSSCTSVLQIWALSCASVQIVCIIHTGTAICKTVICL
eukprot:COSAG02_NODE_1323_length_13255_cov_2.890696_4_plen_144_part_00